MRINILLLICLFLAVLSVSGQRPKFEAKNKGVRSGTSNKKQPIKKNPGPGTGSNNNGIKNLRKNPLKVKNGKRKLVPDKGGKRIQGNKKHALKNTVNRVVKAKGESKQVKPNPKQGRVTVDDVDPGPVTWESCDATTLNNTCLENALDVLEFEKNQIQNFLKQKERAKSHNKISGNKLKKNDEFLNAASLMLTALGGDIENPQCGSSNDSSSNDTRSARAQKDAISNYNFLLNCSNYIAEACTIPNDTFNDEVEAFHAQCAKVYTRIKEISEDCRTNDTIKGNAQTACACWAGARAGMDIAKDLGCKNASSTAKAVKKQKGTCIKAFGQCKKEEDAAIALIHVCMSGDIISEEEAAKGEVTSE